MTDEVVLKRLRMRSWRRGTKEMDLILGRWADARLEGMAEDEVALYDALLEENDHDLYRWVTGAEPAPPRFADLVNQIAAEATRD